MLLDRWRQFLARDLWLVDLPQLPCWKRAGYVLLRVVYLTVRGALRDECALKASALTYITLMSLVPLLAFIFAVAKGWRVDERLHEIIMAQAKNWPPGILQFLEKVFETVENTDVRVLGIVGLALVFVTVVRVVSSIESSFNRIWGVAHGRSLMAKFAYYTSTLVCVPVLLLLVSAANAFLSSEAFLSRMGILPEALQSLYWVGLRASGMLVVVVAFTFLYLSMPNTRVRFGSALLGGLCGGLIWQGWQWLCINVTIVLASYSAVYGAFAAVPISLFWLQVNWMIVLLGAEISCAWQKQAAFMPEIESGTVSYATRRLLAFAIAFAVGRSFRTRGALSPAGLREAFPHVPTLLLQGLVTDLQQGNVLTETKDRGLIPTRDLALVTLADVEQAIAGPADESARHVATAGTGWFPALPIELEQQYHAALAGRNFADLLAGAPPAPEPKPR